MLVNKDKRTGEFAKLTVGSKVTRVSGLYGKAEVAIYEITKISATGYMTLNCGERLTPFGCLVGGSVYTNFLFRAFKDEDLEVMKRNKKARILGAKIDHVILGLKGMAKKDLSNFDSEFIDLVEAMYNKLNPVSQQ